MTKGKAKDYQVRQALSAIERSGVKTMNINHYTYRVTWSREDSEHVGLCAELPSLSWLAPTPEKALSGIRRVVSEVVADMQAVGESIPVALG